MHLFRSYFMQSSASSSLLRFMRNTSSPNCMCFAVSIRFTFRVCFGFNINKFVIEFWQTSIEPNQEIGSANHGKWTEHTHTAELTSEKIRVSPNEHRRSECSNWIECWTRFMHFCARRCNFCRGFCSTLANRAHSLVPHISYTYFWYAWPTFVC